MMEDDPTGRSNLALRLVAPVDHTPVRLLAAAAGLVLIGSYFSVFYHVTDVVGGTPWLVAYVMIAVVLATPLARVVETRTGIAIGAALFLGGFGGYLLLIPDAYYPLFTVDRVLADLVALATGQSVIMLLDADLWAVSIAPGPVFLSWYLMMRRRYALAAVTGAITLGFFALTGDAGHTVTMIGTAAALGMVGFGSIEKTEGTWGQALDVGIVLAVALFVARNLNLVPDGRGILGAQRDTTPTLEAGLVGNPSQVAVGGSISLSPEVRFTVEADHAAYWRVGGFDRYTGQGWVRTGQDDPYRGRLLEPRGATIRLEQEVEVVKPMDTLPAAWKPVHVGSSIEDRTLVTELDGLRPTESLDPGERFRVVSYQPSWSSGDLREAGTDYPESVSGRYLRVPESTPGRLKRRAREIVGDDATPYRAIQSLVTWLQEEKSYSLQTRVPQWDAADAFVFEMDRGYCVHFATALAVMLRLLGVPTRFVVGYTTGEPDEDSWVVRGLHSHAWVEVYFPGIGWVSVDPTPRAPRRAAERRRLERQQARGGTVGRTGDPSLTRATPPDPDSVMGESPGGPPDPAEIGEMESPTPDPGNETASPGNGSGTVRGERGSNDQPQGASDVAVPSSVNVNFGRDRLSLLFGAVGLTLGAYRVGLLERAYRSVTVRRQQPTDSPETDVRRAFERLEFLLAKRFRERRPDETPRAYLTAFEAAGGDVDADARRVVHLYERIRYSGRPTREEAMEAIRLVDKLFDE